MNVQPNKKTVEQKEIENQAYLRMLKTLEETGQILEEAGKILLKNNDRLKKLIEGLAQKAKPEKYTLPEPRIEWDARLNKFLKEDLN